MTKESIHDATHLRFQQKNQDIHNLSKKISS